MKLKSIEIFSVSLLIARVNAYECSLSQTGNMVRKRKINLDSGIKKWGSVQLMEESCQDQILCEAKFHPSVFESIIPQRSWALVEVRLRTWLSDLTGLKQHWQMLWLSRTDCLKYWEFRAELRNPCGSLLMWNVQRYCSWNCIDKKTIDAKWKEKWGKNTK